MNILLLYDCLYPDRHGGVEHRNRRLAEALAERGHEVTLAGWSETAVDVETVGVSVLDLPLRRELYDDEGRRRASTAVAFAAATETLDLGKWDVVETANIPYAHLFPLALRSRLAGVPLLVTWHEYWGAHWAEYVGRGLAPMFRATEWAAAQLADRVAAVSSLTADRLEQHRVGTNGVELLPNGIPYDRITEIRREREGQQGPPVVFAGRLQSNKRLDLLLEAAALVEWNFDVPLVAIIGEGPEEGRLRRRAGELGVVDRVKFTGRLEEVEDVWRRMADAKVAVQPSRREGFGMFPLEAMACGLPVVYCESDESAVGEVVRDGLEGRSVAPSSAELGRTIEGFLASESERGNYGERAVRRAGDFRWGEIASELESLFEDMIQEGTRE